MAMDTKTALLNSAERVARRLGFDGFSYAYLAEEVGIRKASIHHHYPSKATLSVALMQRYHTDFEKACRDIETAEPSGAGRLLALINRYRSALDGGKSLCLCVSFSTSRESLPPDVITQISRFYAMLIFQKSGLKPPTSVGKDPTVRRRRSNPLNPSTLVGGGSVKAQLGHVHMLGLCRRIAPK